MTWYKICAPISHVEIRHETQKAILLASSRTLFWYPKKLTDFSDPENIVLTIEENMEIDGVGDYKKLTKLLDGCSFFSATRRDYGDTNYGDPDDNYGDRSNSDCFPGDPFDFGDN